MTKPKIEDYCTAVFGEPDECDYKDYSKDLDK